MRLDNYLMEAKTRGVDLELGIVKIALKRAGLSFDKLKERFGYVYIRDDDLFKQANRAVDHVEKYNRSLLILAQHSSEIGIKNNAKTDIIFGNDVRVSVKMAGKIQLSSSKGSTMKRVFDDIAKEFIHLKDNFNILSNIKSHLKEMPDVQNKKEYNKWFIESSNYLVDSIVIFLNANREFHKLLIEEALTGKRTFKDNIIASANFLLSPKRFVKIDDTLLEEVLKVTKIRVSKKSNKGKSWGVLRFDMNEDVADFASAGFFRFLLSDRNIQAMLDNLEIEIVIDISKIM